MDDKEKKCETISIPVMLEELKTGLISDDALVALQADKLEMLERIRGIKRLCILGQIEMDEARQKIDEILDERRERLKKLGLLDPDDTSYISD